MGRPARLSREAIVAAATALVEDEGPDALTLRSLGSAIGADPSAVYRHLTDKDELLRAVGDHLLRDVVDDLPGGRAWDDVARTLCLRLRSGAHGPPPPGRAGPLGAHPPTERAAPHRGAVGRPAIGRLRSRRARPPATTR